MKLYRQRLEEWPRVRPGQVNMYVRSEPLPGGGLLQTAYVADNQEEADRLLELSDGADMSKVDKLLREGVEFEAALRKLARRRTPRPRKVAR